MGKCSACENTVGVNELAEGMSDECQSRPFHPFRLPLRHEETTHVCLEEWNDETGGSL